ncbi:2104a06c-6b0e-4469-b0ee-d0ba3fe897df [Thermothielavioides terrestris]|uniref:Guanine nucleotide-exchange factor SEC12 n=1 Tax=Thermothielavioides terrestris TaxID=2587410 RepID=A0A3S4F240_9PEZI|nr:2104a06c-6b0e-4469-b0ee-d0ba3fe897df [Thermothielavioides terrestris]
MAPAIPAAELRLSYPLYALDFDPQDATRLIVGGGGGAARSGVGNKVSVLDAAREDALQLVSELELSPDEDSVNTLAVGARRGNSLLFYAGINSAEADLQKGKNEHFRVFKADLPRKASAEPKISELSRTALFSTTDAEAYQRLLRISGKVGAAATGTIGRSKDAQIAIFDLPSASSGSSTPRLRGKLELSKEAMDMDMIQISDDEHQLVYCDGYDIYTLIIGKASVNGPHCVFTMPDDESSGATARPSLRSIRFLTPTFVLAVANLPQARGAVLQGFRLPKPSDLGKEEREGKARLAVTARVPKHVARATGLAVRNLSPPLTPSTKQGDTQFVIAVTGQDSSITLYTLEHQTVGEISLIANLHPVTTLKEAHLGPISGLAFSHFTPPPEPSASASEKDPKKPSPHLKLASIGSMANTCVVHTLPLKQLPTTTKPKPGPQRSAPRAARYVLALKSRPPSGTKLFVGAALVFALLALLLQGILEVKGLSKPYLGARSVTPVRWHSPGLYYALSESAPPVTPLPSGFFEKYRDLGEAGGLPERKVPVLLHRPAAAGREGEERHGPAREWEALHPAQKEAWKEKLKRAGQWGEEMGEAVFKGILFGEIAGVVGAMVA